MNDTVYKISDTKSLIPDILVSKSNPLQDHIVKIGIIH